jgi:hypothetical protein
VRHLYYSYFPAAAQAVLEQKEGIREFLILRGFADGEIADLIADQIGYIRSHDQPAYCAARRALSAPLRRRLPGICTDK